MQTISFKIMLGLFFLIPFYPFKSATNMNYRIDPTAAVRKALDEQVNAWNSGDLEKAMSYYWNSPEMLWISKAGIQKGYQPVLEDFKKEFTDTSRMGTYSYESLHMGEIANDAVYFVIRWQIVLNGRKIMGGVSSQTWKKMPDGWVIIAEHAS